MVADWGLEFSAARRLLQLSKAFQEAEAEAEAEASSVQARRGVSGVRGSKAIRQMASHANAAIVQVTHSDPSRSSCSAEAIPQLWLPDRQASSIQHVAPPPPSPRSADRSREQIARVWGDVGNAIPTLARRPPTASSSSTDRGPSRRARGVLFPLRLDA